DRTAGEALPALSTSLATGAVLIYPIANFRTSKGKYLEGAGVEPNFTVAVDRKSLLEGRDSQLEKALSLIRDGRQFSKPETTGGIGFGGPDVPPPPKAKPTPAPTTTGKSAVQGTGLSTSSEQRFTRLGDTNSSLPPPKAAPMVKDAKALQVIADFATAIGGLDA